MTTTRGAWVAVAVMCTAMAARAEALGPAQLDELWLQRDNPSVGPQLEPRLREALRSNPNNFELLWRAARERAWVADNAADPRLKKQAGKEAWNYGEKAIEQNPARAEGYYYSGVGVGSHASGIGIVQAVTQGLEKKFVEKIEKAAAIDPWIDRGGPLVALGRYYYTMPWPKQDLEKAERYYEQVLAKFPENLRARHYLAQLKLKTNERDAARTLAVGVRTAPVDYDPAEGKRVQSWAIRTEQALGN